MSNQACKCWQPPAVPSPVCARCGYPRCEHEYVPVKREWLHDVECSYMRTVNAFRSLAAELGRMIAAETEAEERSVGEDLATHSASIYSLQVVRELVQQRIEQYLAALRGEPV